MALSPLHCMPASVSRGRLAKTRGAPWPALRSRQEASLSQRWQRSNTPHRPLPTPQACGQGPRDGASSEGIQEVPRHMDGTRPLPTSPVDPRGSGAGQLLPSKGRPRPGCGREGKGPGASPLSAGLPRVHCPALPAPCLLALTGQPARGGPPPRSPPTPGCGGPASCLAHPFPSELEAMCGGRDS